MLSLQQLLSGILGGASSGKASNAVTGPQVPQVGSVAGILGGQSPPTTINPVGAAGNPAWSATQGPSPNTAPASAPAQQGALNPWGIAGQLIGGVGNVRKPVNISQAFGFGGVDNQVSDNESGPGDDE